MKVSGRYLEDFWKVSGRCLEGTLNAVGVVKVSEPNSFHQHVYPNSF